MYDNPNRSALEGGGYIWGGDCPCGTALCPLTTWPEKKRCGLCRAIAAHGGATGDLRDRGLDGRYTWLPKEFMDNLPLKVWQNCVLLKNPWPRERGEKGRYI